MPEQADRWTWLVIAAYTQLRLARQLVDDLRLPWERQIRPEEADPGASAKGVSATACNSRHTRPSTEIHDARSGTPKGHPKTAQNPLSRSQKGCMS